MPDQKDNQPSPARKTHRYTPWSVIAGPLSVGFGLSLGKSIGEALEWGKVAILGAEWVVAAAFALVFAVTINYFFGKQVEVTERRQP
jgi:hypothetical protein